MRIKWHAAAVILLSAGIGLCGQAAEQESVRLAFDQPMSRLTRSLAVNSEFWRYFITVPENERDDVRDPKEVARYIIPHEQNDASVCRLRSRLNYVSLFRRVPPGYEQAGRLSWKWSIQRHPHGGKIGGAPNDQSMQVYVFYREVKANAEESYTALSFVWTEKTTDVQQKIRGRMPWNGSPRAEIAFIAIRNGSIPGELSEDVDLRAEYQKVFGRESPSLYAIMLMADSNEVPADVGEMTTDATIRELNLTK